METSSWIAVGGVLLTILNGWVVARSMKQESHNAKLYERLGALEVLVSGQYLTRNEFRETMRDQTAALTQLFTGHHTKI